MRFLSAAIVSVALAGTCAYAADQKKDDPNQIGNRDIGKCVNFDSFQ